MPELPEVETVRADLQDTLPGHTIKGVELCDAKILKGIDANILINKKFAAIKRRGKYLIFRFVDTDWVMVGHLRMTGQMVYRGKSQSVASGHPADVVLEDLPNKHTRWHMQLDNNAHFFFQDSRRFGTAEIIQKKNLQKYFEKFGIEPLTPQWNLDHFIRVLKPRKTNIKAALLNQELVWGLGNIYVDEACFTAGIRPMTSANKVTKKAYKLIFDAIEPMLQASIELGGTSVADFVDGQGRAGGYGDFLNVYGRKGEPCKVCKSHIVKTVCAGRGTHYCPKCQN